MRIYIYQQFLTTLFHRNESSAWLELLGLTKLTAPLRKAQAKESQKGVEGWRGRYMND